MTSTVKIKSAAGNLLELTLAEDEQRRPLFKTSVQDFLQSSVQVGEPGYANFLPRIGGVYAISDFSGGVGSKTQKSTGHKDSNRYWYCEGVDCSAGYAQKGPAVTTLTAPANSGALSGYFELSGVPYLVLGRRIASWASDSLTAVKDYGANNAGVGATTFFQLAAEASIESNSPAGSTTIRIDAPSDMVAQQIQMDDAGVLPIGRIDLKMSAAGTLTGDVRVRIMAELNGRPSMTSLATATISAASISTSAQTVYSFRFDDDELFLAVTQTRFWVVIDVAAATSTNYVDILRDNATSTYARGAVYTSADDGNSWAAIGAGEDIYFDVYAKTPATTAFVANTVSGSANSAEYTTNGTAYSTTSPAAYVDQLCVVGDRMVGSLRSGATTGALAWSLDGRNWSEAIPVGDLTIGITSLTALGDVLIVGKQDSIWAVDITMDQSVIQLDQSSVVSSNGQGACTWKGTTYIPFSGRLVAVQGDFDSGFTVYTDVSPSVLPEWGSPHGISRVVAVGGDRYHLYAVLTGTSGYRLYKASEPLRQIDDKSSPNWHGSITQVGSMGDGTNSITRIAIFDPGGSSSPHLFFTISTSGNVGRITLPRTADPSADSSYSYDTSAAGTLYIPTAHLGFPVHPKAWTHEALTFLSPPAASDYCDILYDLKDRESYKRLGRLWDSDVLAYPVGTESRLLARQILIRNNASTSSPLVQAIGLTGAVRPVEGEGPRSINFTVISKDGMSADTLGRMLGTGQRTQTDALYRATRGGTRTLIGPADRTYNSVLFLNTTDTLGTNGEHYIEVEAVQTA